MQREPFVVQTWSEESGSLVPIETITFETVEQANRLAAFAARRRAGVTIFRVPAGSDERLVVIASIGRVPRST